MRPECVWSSARHPRTLQYLVLLWSVLIAGALSWFLRGQVPDDPYITYRYARNLASGQGFVYNPGEYVLSTTAPGYALLLALLIQAELSAPTSGYLISCISMAAGGLALWGLGRVWRARLLGAVGLLLYPCSPLLFVTVGSEAPLYLALTLLAMLGYARGQERWSALLLALATLMRPDALIAAVVIAAHRLLSRPRPLPIYAGVLLIWSLFAWSYFGSPLPATLAAKQRQALLPETEGFGTRLIELLALYWQAPFFRLHVVLAGLGLLLVWRGQRQWFLLLAWNVLYTLSYFLLHVPGYAWYFAPLAVGLTVLLGLSLAGICRLVPLPVWQRRWLVALALLALLLPQVHMLARQQQQENVRSVLYQAVGEWLAANTPPGTSVGALEVGIIGYYAQRPIVDFAGLLQPDTARQLSAEGGYEAAALWAVKRYRPAYIVLHAGLFAELEQQLRSAGCQVRRSFDNVGYTLQLLIYECAWR